MPGMPPPSAAGWIAPPVVSVTRVMWYSIGPPSYASNLPAEEPAVERDCARGVVRRHLEVNELPSHGLLLSVRIGRDDTPPPARAIASRRAGTATPRAGRTRR